YRHPDGTAGRNSPSACGRYLGDLHSARGLGGRHVRLLRRQVARPPSHVAPHQPEENLGRCRRLDPGERHHRHALVSSCPAGQLGSSARRPHRSQERHVRPGAAAPLAHHSAIGGRQHCRAARRSGRIPHQARRRSKRLRLHSPRPRRYARPHRRHALRRAGRMGLPRVADDAVGPTKSGETSEPPHGVTSTLSLAMCPIPLASCSSVVTIVCLAEALIILPLKNIPSILPVSLKMSTAPVLLISVHLIGPKKFPEKLTPLASP